MRRIDPDAMFGFILSRWGHAVAAQVCPEVAEPEPVTVAETATHFRYPGDLAPMMDIHGPQRRRVMFSSPESGYPGDAKRAVAYLVPGMLYSTVSVDVGSSRTNVELAECPGVRFNSVHFIDWPPAACPERPAEPVSERCDCAMFGYTHTRRECDKYRDKPAEPSPAPAADPRLTDDEIQAAVKAADAGGVFYVGCGSAAHQIAKSNMEARYSAVADAQLAKADLVRTGWL